MSIKLCILVGYLRSFKADRATKQGIWFGAFGCAVFYLTAFFVDVFRCKPVKAAWNPTIKGKCMSYAVFPWATGIFNMISDFYILVLLLPPIWRMNMSLAQCLGMGLIIGLGIS